MATNERCNCSKPNIIDFDYCTKCGLKVGNVEDVPMDYKTQLDKLINEIIIPAEKLGKLVDSLPKPCTIVDMKNEDVQVIVKIHNQEKHYSKPHHESLTEQGVNECLENQIKQLKEDLKHWESWAEYVKKYMGEDDFDNMQTEGHI